MVEPTLPLAGRIEDDLGFKGAGEIQMMSSWRRNSGPVLGRVWFLALVTVLVTGCEGTYRTKYGEQPAQPPAAVGADGSGGASTTAVGAGTGFEGDKLEDPSSLLSKRTVYFDYDSDNVVEGDRAVVEAHAEYLASNPNSEVTLEGHADERGSREYNVALGERRASSVRQLMSLLGATDGQIRMVSYGEERPVVETHGEESWSANRRVEIVYRQ